VGSVAWFDTPQSRKDCVDWAFHGKTFEHRPKALNWRQSAATPTWFATVLAGALLATLLFRFFRTLDTVLAQPLGSPVEVAPYPRTYAGRTGYTVSMLFVAVVLIILGLAGVWIFGAMVETRDTAIGWALTAGLSMLAAVGVLMALDALQSKLVLHAEALEIRLWQRDSTREENPGNLSALIGE
jgi:hypothetical protein